MSNLVIVAIPDENDRVWKVSSEKIPHMTLLYLGQSEDVANVDKIVQFVEHAANTTLQRFYLPVDRRGELGDDKADVLFFRKGRYDYKAVRDFRAVLLKDNNLKTAYDNATQHLGPWNPHLTLGYPDSPAKPDDTDRDFGFYDVAFNKIAIWTDDYDGPEFLLKDWWDEWEALESVPMDVAMGDVKVSDLANLEHFGVKGMRWGQSKDTTVTVGDKTKQVTAKKAEKLDVKWEKQIYSTPGAVAVHNASASHFNSGIGAVNDKHKGDFSKEDFGNPDKWSSGYKSYMKDVNALQLESTKTAVTAVHGNSPTGKRKAELEIAPDGETAKIRVKDADAKHAAQDYDGPLEFIAKLKNGRFIEVVEVDELDAVAQSQEAGAEYLFDMGLMSPEEFLEHYGVKGMRWGVRAAKATGRFVSDVNFEMRTERGSSGEASKATNAVASAARKPFKKEDLPAVKARHGDYAKLKNRAKKPLSKEARAYRKDAKETYIKRLETEANKMKNASGDRQYTIRERGIDLPAQGGDLPKSKYMWEVSSRAVKHATTTPDLTLELVMDSEGWITDVKPVPVEDNMAQMAELGADFLAHLGLGSEIATVDVGAEFMLEHFGVKGMRWGHRKEAPTAVAPTATSVVPHGRKRKTKLKVEGGENHSASPDAIKVAEARAKFTKSGAAALSNNELREVANRLQLENQVAVLTSSKGKTFVQKSLEEEGKTLVRTGVRSGARRATPVVAKKVRKAAATAAVAALL